MRIRNACLKDASKLLPIYAHYVKNTAITFEIEVPSVFEFEERMVTVLKRYPYLVLEDENKIMGYAYASPLNSRQAYDWSCEISIYLDSSSTKKGYGRQLDQQMEMILKEMGILNIYACIAFPENEDEYLSKNSVEFHHHLDYQEAGVFHYCGYKFNRWYHIMWMEKIIGEKQLPMPKVLSYTQIKRDSMMEG